MIDTEVLVIIEHFLTRKGRDYFEDWIGEVQEVLNLYKGFESLKRIFDPHNPDRTIVYLRFEKLRQLRAWSTSDDHEAVLGLIKPYQKKKQKSQIYTTINHG